MPNNISSRIVGVVRADGVVDTSTRVTTAFRDSTTATNFRTVASVDGAGFWMTGSTSVSAYHGLHFAKPGEEAYVDDNSALSDDLPVYCSWIA